MQFISLVRADGRLLYSFIHKTPQILIVTVILVTEIFYPRRQGGGTTSNRNSVGNGRQMVQPFPNPILLLPACVSSSRNGLFEQLQYLHAVLQGLEM